MLALFLMMREVFRNEHYRVEFGAEQRIIRLVRTAVPQTTQLMASLVSELLGALQPLRPAHILLDMRLAPGNNDPEFEQAALVALRRLLRGFGKVAVLVHSAVGRLHFQRMSRESGQDLHIFSDESEALRFLREQPLPQAAPPS